MFSDYNNFNKEKKKERSNCQISIVSLIKCVACQSFELDVDVVNKVVNYTQQSDNLPGDLQQLFQNFKIKD